MLQPGRRASSAGTTSSASLGVTGYTLDDLSNAVVDREAPALRVLSVDGLTLNRPGRSVTQPSDGALRLLRRAHRDGLKAELLVSNYSDRIGDFSPWIASRMLRDKDNRAAVVRQVARLVAKGGWDGVAVDLESLRHDDAPGLTSFVTALQQQMPVRRTVSVCLMAATHTADYRDMGYDLSGLAQHATRLALMTYDQHGPSWSGPGPIGALPWQRQSLAALRVRVPASKVDLGVAGYGYSWPPSGTGHDWTDAAARHRVTTDGATAVWHATQGEWSATLSDGTVMWWSDGRSWDLRAQLASDEGLHGLALWRLGSADPLPH